jgi:hypothetical protein
MDVVTFVFEGELASIGGRSGPARNGSRRTCPLDRRTSVKDAIEALGVPHTEVYGLSADDEPIEFDHILLPGQRVRVKPGEPPVDVTRSSRFRRGLDGPRFLVDVNVGKLATLLRVVGLDTAYRPEWDDAEIAERAEAEGRVVLSKDTGLLKRARIEWGRLIRSEHPDEQLREVLSFFAIPEVKSMSRCLRCNVPLEPVDKADVLHLLEPKTRKYFEEFWRCPACGRVYWAGSHVERIGERLESLGIAIGAEAGHKEDHD